MIRYYQKLQHQLQEIETPQDGCWINIYPPFHQQQIEQLANSLNIFQDFFTDSLDTDEKSRFDIDDSNKLIVIKTPIVNTNAESDSAVYITIPIGIILHPKHIITISPYKNPVIDSFINNSIKRLDPRDQTIFILTLFSRCVFYFLYYLKAINTKRNEIEKEVLKSEFNKELTQLLDIQKSLVYFSTSLRSNELLLLKMQRTNFIMTDNSEDTKDIMDDVIIDTSQALEMSNIYTVIMNSSAETYSSIISNNQNALMKRLTSITIILMIPTLVASLWGMNVIVPFMQGRTPFYIIVLISFVVSIGIGYLFLRRRLF